MPVLLTNQEKLDPQSFLQAVGWYEKPGSRLIYIATPHRGTEFAHRGISRLGHHLIRPPDWILAEIPPFQESIPQLGGRPFPTSIVGLSPASGFLRTIDKARMRVPIHSVIPLLGDPENPFAHDGIVPL